jgi:hypothetical protein
MSMTVSVLRFSLSIIVCLQLSACSSFGPQRLPTDRLDYADAVSSSWHRQMLLNIVRIRYAEMPMFLDVTSVINQYTVAGGLTASAVSGGDNEIGASGSFIDRPTMTYSPLTGEDFTRSLLTPISPIAIFSLIQSGWSVERTFQLCVRRINGINNQSAASVQTAADPEFKEVIDTLGRIQRKGALNMRLIATSEPGPMQQQQGIYLLLEDPSPDIAMDSQRIRSILNLDPQAREISVTYGPQATFPSEVALLTRSILDIMAEMAYSVAVPTGDVEAGRAGFSLYDSPEGSLIPRPIAIHSGDEPPDGTRIAVRHRGLWFWIDDTDFQSKMTLGVLLTLFSLSAGSTPAMAPVMTIN